MAHSLQPRLLAPAITLFLAASSCTTRPPSLPSLGVTPIARNNAHWVTTALPVQDFRAEAAYVTGRRQRVGVHASGRGVGIAMSGGGQRSATVNLGVLQGLEETGLLRNADYLSSVSGGSYTAAWYVSHLLPSGDNPVSSKSGSGPGRALAYQNNNRQLLQVSQYGPTTNGAIHGAIDELQAGSGFVLGKGNWRLMGPLIGQWAALLPFNTVFDLGLHFKPTRGKFNWYHLTRIYEQAIRRTYLRAPASLIAGQEGDADGFFRGNPHEITMAEVNHDRSTAPYLIINAAMANEKPAKGLFNSTALPFEFSRFNCGAPYIGFVGAEHFGYPIAGARNDERGFRQPILRSSSLSFGSRVTKPIRLSSAVAASGAALDASMGGTVNDEQVENLNKDVPGAVPVPKINTKRLWLDSVLKPLNLNLRYQNRNFGMTPRGAVITPSSRLWNPSQYLADRRTEVTKDRFDPTTNSNGLYLSDGAHVDNLGIFALSIRSDVTEIWCFDATKDSKYVFADLDRAQTILKQTGWNDIHWPEGSPFDIGELKKSGRKPEVWKMPPVFRGVLTKKLTGRTITLWYVKLSYREEDGMENGKPLPFVLADGKPFVDADGKASGLHGWLREFRNGTGGYFSGKRSHTNFPHTSTANLSFSTDDFVAYREIGRVLARHLARAKQL